MWIVTKSFTFNIFRFFKWSYSFTTRNSCRSNLWSTPMLMLWNFENKILRKKPGDEAFRVSLKFPRRGWDQRLANLNRFSSVETRSCYSCLVLNLLGKTAVWQDNQKRFFFFTKLELVFSAAYWIKMLTNLLKIKSSAGIFLGLWWKGSSCNFTEHLFFLHSYEWLLPTIYLVRAIRKLGKWTIK